MKYKSPFSLFFIIGISFGINAQETEVTTPLVTDRPDATEASSTVGAGVLQIEAGGFYTYYEENNNKSETYGYNTTLVRYGVLENLELRLGWNFEEIRFSSNGTKNPNVLSGFSPLLAEL